MLRILVIDMQNTLAYTEKNRFLSELINLYHATGLPLHDNLLGPKIYSEFQKFSLVILLRRSKKVLRDFVAELLESKWVSWLDLKEIPSKSVLHDWCKKYTVEFLRELNTIFLRNENPELLAIDATGVDAYQRSKHYEKRAKIKTKFNKLSILIDVKNHLIYDHVLQMKPRHDVKAAESIFKRTPLRKVKILGDKGYDSEPLHEVVQSKQNILFAPVRKSSRTHPKGWNRRRCAKGDQQYNQRPNVESCIHSLKKRRIPILRSKLHFMKKREMALQIVIHNVEKISKAIKFYLRMMLNIILDRTGILTTFPDTNLLNHVLYRIL